MKLKLAKRIVTLFLAVITVAVPVLAANDLTDATVKSYEDKIEWYQQKKSEALRELELINASSSTTLLEIQKFDEVIRINQEMKNLEMAQLETIEKQIEDAKINIAAIEKKLADQQNAFRKRMVADYMDEDIDFIELLFSAKSLSDLLSKVERILAILENDRKVISGIEETKKLLENEKARLEKAEKLQIERVAQLEAIIRDNEALLEAKEEYLQELAANEEAWNAVYKANAEAEAELDAELKKYLEEKQKESQNSYIGDYSSESILGWPIKKGAYYHISSEQGDRILDGEYDYHRGIDIACYAGTDILAANSGKVLISEHHWSYGNYVLIDHGGGLATLYAHMSERLVAAGDTVKAGQLIGHCGLTGYTKGYHLHFEVRVNGEFKNPRNYLVFP